MIKFSLLGAVSAALKDYQRAISLTTDAEARDEYSRLVSIVEKIEAAVQAGDDAKLKLLILGFSRQVSDSLSLQPPEFKPLSESIARLKKAVT